MSDVAKCPFCKKYIDITLALEKCPKCHASLSNIQIEPEANESNRLATLYAFWAALGFFVISITLFSIIGTWTGIAPVHFYVGIIIFGTPATYVLVDNYFSQKNN